MKMIQRQKTMYIKLNKQPAFLKKKIKKKINLKLNKTT